MAQPRARNVAVASAATATGAIEQLVPSFARSELEVPLAHLVVVEHEASEREFSMSFMGNAHLNIMWVVEPDDESEWDRIFTSHGEGMKGHPREGDAALLSYTISKGPQLADPLDPNSASTGKLVYVLDEYYESPAGVARHWQDGMENWGDDLRAVMEASTRTTVTTLHTGTVIQALW